MKNKSLCKHFEKLHATVKLLPFWHPLVEGRAVPASERLKSELLKMLILSDFPIKARIQMFNRNGKDISSLPLFQICPRSGHHNFSFLIFISISLLSPHYIQIRRRRRHQYLISNFSFLIGNRRVLRTIQETECMVWQRCSSVRESNLVQAMGFMLTVQNCRHALRTLTIE